MPTEEQRAAQRERQRRYRERHGQADKGPCTLDGCPRRARARGMCTTHLERERRWGSPLLVAKCYAPGNTEAERMWAQVREEGDCWLFTGPPGPDGYARVGVSGQAVHRLAWTDMVGDIPDGLDLDHLCHNADPSCAGGPSCAHRRCVNPEHLDPVPRSVNSLRRWARERAAS